MLTYCQFENKYTKGTERYKMFRNLSIKGKQTQKSRPTFIAFHLLCCLSTED